MDRVTQIDTRLGETLTNEALLLAFQEERIILTRERAALTAAAVGKYQQMYNSYCIVFYFHRCKRIRVVAHVLLLSVPPSSNFSFGLS